MHGVEVGRAAAAAWAPRSSLVIRDGEILVPERRTVLRARRRPAGRHAPQAAGEDRGAAAPGRPRAAGWRSGWAAPQARPLTAQLTGGLQISASSSATTDLLARDQLLELVADDDGDADARARPGGPPRPTCPSRLATRRTSGLSGVVGPDRPTSATWAFRGALPVSPLLKPASTKQVHGAPGQAVAVAGVVDADRHLLREDLLAGVDRRRDALGRVGLARERLGRGVPAPEPDQHEQRRPSTARVTADFAACCISPPPGARGRAARCAAGGRPAARGAGRPRGSTRRATRRRGRTGRRRTWSPRRAGWPAAGCPSW